MALPLTWGRDLDAALAVAMAALPAGAVWASLHHAEAVVHRVGEPSESLVLAVAVTVIGVLIVTLMISDGPTLPLSAGTRYSLRRWRCTRRLVIPAVRHRDFSSPSTPGRHPSMSNSTPLHRPGGWRRVRSRCKSGRSARRVVDARRVQLRR